MDNLPIEIQIEILQFLDSLTDASAAACVSKRWNSLLKEPFLKETIWQRSPGTGKLFQWGTHQALGSEMIKMRPTVPENGDKEHFIDVSCGHTYTVLCNDKGEVFILGRIGSFQAVDIVRKWDLSEEIEDLKVVKVASQALKVVFLSDCGKIYVRPNYGKLFQVKVIGVNEEPIFKYISACYDFFVALSKEGKIFVGGRVPECMRPFPTSDSTLVPIIVKDERNQEVFFRDIAAGDSFALAIDQSGDLWGWGENQNGELGLKDLKYITTPTRVPVPVKCKQVAASLYHSTFIDIHGKVWGCGQNLQCQVGIPDVKSIDEFVPVPTLENVQFQTIACGWFHTLALTTNGTLWGWGRNEKYTLAQSEPNACLPMKLNTNLRFKKIAAGLASSV